MVHSDSEPIPSVSKLERVDAITNLLDIGSPITAIRVLYSDRDPFSFYSPLVWFCSSVLEFLYLLSFLIPSFLSCLHIISVILLSSF